ncbi:MAG: hypothetical protein F6K54_23330 [Okeania sp. SIO3B5]|uniref:hypothetical protein n=1 Tax=Okeania sp. SIO3B5 TaxID=2607811 RepID=UPI001400C622|nr:hypothetical protein [Okeania sp. SIO3B5]NEO55742.1 hypothetical protein [Okeania sp. SIO3B5]
MDISVISGKVYQSTTGLTLNQCIRAIIRVLHGYFGYQWLCCRLLVNNTKLRARQGFGHGCTDGYFSCALTIPKSGLDRDLATDVRMDISVISGKVYQSTTGLTLNPCIRAIIRVLHGYFSYQWLCCQL